MFKIKTGEQEKQEKIFKIKTGAQEGQEIIFIK